MPALPGACPHRRLRVRRAPPCLSPPAPTDPRGHGLLAGLHGSGDPLCPASSVRTWDPQAGRSPRLGPQPAGPAAPMCLGDWVCPGRRWPASPPRGWGWRLQGSCGPVGSSACGVCSRVCDLWVCKRRDGERPAGPASSTWGEGAGGAGGPVVPGGRPGFCSPARSCAFCLRTALLKRREEPVVRVTRARGTARCWAGGPGGCPATRRPGGVGKGLVAPPGSPQTGWRGSRAPRALDFPSNYRFQDRPSLISIFK